MMNKAKICLLAAGCLCSTAWAAAADILHVSPRGNDQTGNGSAGAPYLSINMALEKGMQERGSADTLYIRVAAGDYYLTEPVVIRNTTRPVVISGEGEGRPRLMGGLPVTGWEPCGEGRYRAYIPQAARYGLQFEQFYVDGKRAVPARTPNEGWRYVKSSRETAVVPGKPLAPYAVQQLDFHPADWQSLKGATAEKLQDMKFRFYHKWDITRKSPRHVVPDSARACFDGRSMKPWNPLNGQTRYFMYNYLRALDAPGEWYYDRREGYLYYQPRKGEQLEKAHCVIPVLHQWMRIEGTPTAPVKGIRLENLSFQYASYTIAPMGEEPQQAAAGSEAALVMEYADDVTLRRCELLHTGAYALRIGRSSHRNRVEQCYLADLGAGGIQVGETRLPEEGSDVTSHNVIDNNIITSAGHEQPCGVGIALFHTHHNRISHNDIFDILYSGISVGWVWGYSYSPSKGNEILYNHVHHIGWGELSDMGAVYTLGPSEGTRICHNYIHDVWTYDYGGWGLYTDEGSTGIELSHNLVVRCKSGGFHQHYGKENRVENNILAFAHLHQAQLTRAEKHLSFHFKRNILLYDRGESLAREAWSKAVLDIDSNLYWRTDRKPVEIQGMPFARWKQEKEPHSIEADPLFRRPEADDFHFTSTRNAQRIGFEPFDYTACGVYGSSDWKALAQLDEQRAALFRRIAGDGVRIMSYNIRNGNGMDNRHDVGRVAARIAASGADLVALQEVDSLTRRSGGTYIAGQLAALTGLHATYAPAIDYDGGKYGIALLSREKPQSSYHVALPGREEKRTLMVVEFKDYVMLNTHLSLTEADQLASVDILVREARKVTGKPVFLAGDFNSTPDSAAQKRLSRYFERLTSPDWVTCNGVCIDFIFRYRAKEADKKNTSVRCVERQLVPDDISSDHRPVWVDMKY